jgi:DNA-binding PucR family transcriptional regulator
MELVRVLLRDLLAVPELHLRLLCEPSGALDRTIRRVYTTDLLQPSRYLSGGELVISGLMWRRSAADSEVFVQALIEGGATALAAGDALLGSVPDDLIEACRRHGLPLIEVPTEVSFADVTEHMVTSVSAERGARRSGALGRQRQLLSAIASGSSLDELTDRVSVETGRVCRVLTATGRHVVSGPQQLDAADLDRVTRTFLTAVRLPAVAAGRGSSPYSLFAVGPALEHRLTSWIVAVEGVWSEWEPEHVEAVGELAAIAALDRVRRDEGLRAARHIADEAVAMADSGGSQLEIAVRLRQAGLDPAAPVVAVVADFAGRPDMRESARTVLDDVAAGFGPTVVATSRDSRAVALLAGDRAGLAADLRLALGRLAPGVGRLRLAVGVSAPSAPGALSGALEEARYARRLAELRTGEVSVVTGDEVTSHVLLLATVPDDVRRTFATRVLGQVLDYDERNDAGLRQTLEAFLECSGSWSRAAEMLHLHVNTVRYRVERIEELTGRDLSRLEDRVDVFLALRSL